MLQYFIFKATCYLRRTNEYFVTKLSSCTQIRDFQCYSSHETLHVSRLIYTMELFSKNLLRLFMKLSLGNVCLNPQKSCALWLTGEFSCFSAGNNEKHRLLQSREWNWIFLIFNIRLIVAATVSTNVILLYCFLVSFSLFFTKLLVS